MCSPLNIVSHKSIEVNIRVKTFVSLLKFAGLRLDCIALTEWYLHHMWHLVELQENWWLLVVFITDITLDCITDITFVCIPKISLSSEFDTEHTGLVLFPHSQGEEGGEAGRRGVWGVFLRLFLLAHIGACAWHVHASVVSDGTISTYSVTAVNFCQTLLPGTSDGQLQSHAFPHSAHGLCIIHFSSHCWYSLCYDVNLLCSSSKSPTRALTLHNRFAYLLFAALLLVVFPVTQLCFLSDSPLYHCPPWAWCSHFQLSWRLHTQRM